MSEDEIYQRGFNFRCAGQYSEAKDAFRQVLGSNPRHVNSRLQMALIMGFEGDFDESLAQLTVLTTENPGNDDVRYELAMTQFMLGMNDEACANLQTILARNPMHEKAQQQAIYC